MWDLFKKYDLQKADGFTKHHKLPSFTKDKDLMQQVNDEAINTNTTYITYDNAEILNYPNSIISKYGYDVTHIIHPHEDIAFLQKWNFDDIITQFGICHDVPSVKYNTAFKNKKMYYIDNKGFETGDSYTGNYNDAIMTSRLASSFMDMSALKFSFYRNIKVHYCMKVGETLFLKPHSEHETDVAGMNFEGGYLIDTSDILFTRDIDKDGTENIKCVCTLVGFRSRLSKN
jgi:hypothetical protein